jgi:hypothetical protein
MAVLKHGDDDMRQRATDVLLSAVQHDPAPLREFLLKEPNQDCFQLLLTCAPFGDPIPPKISGSIFPWSIIAQPLILR